MSAAVSNGVRAPPLGTVLPWLLQAASLIILLLVLVSPAPLSGSDISLLTVAPAAVNHTDASGNASSTSLIFGTSSSSSASLPLSSSANFSSVSLSPLSTPSTSSVATLLSTGAASPTPSPAPAATASSSVSVAPPVSTAVALALRRRSVQLLAREDLNKTKTSGLGVNGTVAASSSASPQVRLIFGPLGSCGTSASGQRTCTSARLSPRYDSSVLATEESGSFSTIGLPERLPTTPILLLVVVVTLLLSVALGVPSILALASPRKFGSPLEAGPAERNLRSAQHWIHLATLVGWVLLAATGISMRITSASARTAFNAANATRALPLSAMRNGAEDALTLEASLGKAFGLMWAVLGLLAAAAWLERKRLRRADAVSQARADVEAQWVRGTLQAAMEHIKGGAADAKAPATLAALPPVHAVPGQGHYWLAQDPATAAYVYPPNPALPQAHLQAASASPFWLNQAEKFGASTAVPDMKRSISPASAYEHHMRASSDIDSHSLTGSVSFSRQEGGAAAGDALPRGASPAPTYWTSEDVERVRDEAKEARHRAELDRVAREQRADEDRELERWEMARRRKAGGLGYH